MSTSQHDTLVDHYSAPDLADAIFAGLEKTGKTSGELKPEDLAAVDEFHVRGREATIELAEQLDLDSSTHVLDVGSGVGGASRYLASTYRCRVTGIDLTDSYCQAARVLAERTALADRVTYRCGDALDMPFEDASFDIAWTQHAAMNIADKAALYAEINRVLKPGGKLAVYDIVAGVGGPLLFPVPWARDASISFLAAPDELRTLLEQAGFEILSWRDTTEAGCAWFRKVAERLKSLDGAPALGFHLLLGPDFKEMARAQLRNLLEKRIGLIETVVRKPAQMG